MSSNDSIASEARVVDPSHLVLKEKGYEYHRLTLFDKKYQENKGKDGVDYEISRHESEIIEDITIESQIDDPIPRETILGRLQENNHKLAICITIYNEPFRQVVESLAGLYRTYYELIELDESFIDRISIFIISDGYDKLKDPFLDSAKEAGIYGEVDTKFSWSMKDKEKEMPSDQELEEWNVKQDEKEFKELNFINQETSVRYGTHNLAHCFTKEMTFDDWEKGLSLEEKRAFQVNGLNSK